MLKKIFIIFCMLFMTEQVLAADSLYPDVSKNAVYYPALMLMHEHGLMIGCDDGKFRPNSPIRRDDYSRIIIKALKLDNKEVVRGVEFTDLNPENVAYDCMQIALYYDLLNVPFNSKTINLKSSISRKEAFTSVANYLNKTPVSISQAKNILGKYSDRNSLTEKELIDFAKADLLNLIVVMTKENKINPYKPLTRAEMAVMVSAIYHKSGLTKECYNSNKNFEGKMKSVGSRLKGAYVDGDIVTIPVKTEIPVQMLTKADSQKSHVNDIQEAVLPWNLITNDRYLIIKRGAKLEGKVTVANKRKFLFRNGKLKVETLKIRTTNNNVSEFPAVLIVDDKIRFGNKIFKFKRIKSTVKEKSYVKLLKDIQVDLTTGEFVNERL